MVAWGVMWMGGKGQQGRCLQKICVQNFLHISINSIGHEKFQQNDFKGLYAREDSLGHWASRKKMESDLDMGLGICED